MLNPRAASAAAPPSASRRLPGSLRGGGWMHLALVGVISMLLVYVAASIVLTVPLPALLTLLGLAGALLLWRLPRGALQIADAVALGLIAVVLYAAGLDLVSYYLAGIVGTLALRRHARGWLYLVTGAVVLASGWSSVTMAWNEGPVPRLFTEAVPWLDLHLPVLTGGFAMIAVGLVFLTTGTWKMALRIDLLALALLLAAVMHVTAAVLGFMSSSLPMILADVYPGTYSYEDDSYATASGMISVLQMSSKGLIMGALIPLALVVAAVVRLVRQPSITPRGIPLQPTSLTVATLTGLALVVPGFLILVLGLTGDDSPLQLILPFVIDGAGLLLWAVAVVAWWRNTGALRGIYAPGGDVTRTDLVVTLLLAAAPGLLAMFDIALVFIP
ncbi:hypothetical protein [Brachybacterium massiliense]|uniref:hypothetical protein n=1 Tax=Brachybacterium massiliense TaxID=1755098 RepID=UPI000B3BC803|nr:hypothetical protein [Brachybacterium massiliense]